MQRWFPTLTISAVLLLAACSDEAAEAPVFSPAGGIFSGPVEVTLSTPTDGASIRYTYAPDVPSETNGTLYDGPIDVTTPVEISAVAFRQGMDPSPVVSETYDVYLPGLPAPLIEPGPGTYLPPLTVELSSTITSGVIGYTTDGTDPVPGSAIVYAGPFDLTTPGVVEVRAVSYQTGVMSIVSSATYTLAEGQVSTPYFLPVPGRHTVDQPVTIGQDTPGAEVRYTLDGTFPTCTTGTVYTSPVDVPTGATLSAVGCRDGWLASTVESGEYEFGFWMMVNGDAILHSTDGGDTWSTLSATPGLWQLETDSYGNWVASSAFGSAKHSQDRGTTWANSTIGMSVVRAITTDTFGTWIAGGDNDLAPQLRDSTDNGATWDAPTAPAVASGIDDIATDGVNWVAVASSGEILRSTNAGITWTEVLDTDRVFYDVATNGTGTFVAAGLQGGGYPYTTDSYIAVSTDNGQTWTEATYTSVARGALSLAAADGGAFLIGGGGTLIRSNDGITWTALPPIDPSRDVRYLGTDDHGLWVAALYADGAAGGEVYRSFDDGSTWTAASDFPAATSVGPVVFGY